MSSSNKRQQTMAKRAREQAVREKRERKNEKKQATAAERAEESADRAAAKGFLPEHLPTPPQEPPAAEGTTWQ